jgi:hypothetical protein
MKFEETNKTIYCKDGSYQSAFNNAAYFMINKTDYADILYFKGYIVHNICGPAVIWADGIKSWYLNGIEYKEKEYWKIIDLKNKNRVLDEI